MSQVSLDLYESQMRAMAAYLPVWPPLEAVLATDALQDGRTDPKLLAGSFDGFVKMPGQLLI